MTRASGVVTAVSMTALIVVADLHAPLAFASGGGQDLNGTYLAQSNGDWAQTNEQYRDEQTVRSTWTITTTCRTALDCAGRVTSDAGWSSDVTTTSGDWYVRRKIENWEPCADGTSAPGMQLIRFYPVGPDGGIDMTSTTYAGEDTTISPSGSCGRSRSLAIKMPFKLQKV